MGDGRCGCRQGAEAGPADKSSPDPIYVPPLQTDWTPQGRYQKVVDQRAQVASQLQRGNHVARKASGPAGHSKIPEGGGSPLPAQVRAKMEPKLGADLSGVQIHTNSAQAATKLGARAFTVGNDVHFNAGEYAPGSKEGDRLLAHELTHVVQGQKGGIQRKAEEGEEEVSEPGEPAEQEADAKGDQVAGELHDGGADEKEGGDAKEKEGEGEHAGHDHKAPAVGRKIYREEAAEGAEAKPKGDDDDEQIDFSGLELEGELEGHPGLRIMRKPGDQANAKANITLTSNPPTFTNKPAADIAAQYGPNIAGHTKPKYTVSPPTGTKKNINITVTMDYLIELGNEYTGGRGQVLKDHEMGHVTIGDKNAQKYWVDGLKAELEANTELTKAKVQTALANGQTNFDTNEGKDSRAYDGTDYPRMTEAYKGVTTPLADLASASAPVAALNKAVDAFSGGTPTGDKAVSDAAQSVIGGKAGLAPNDLSDLQYNAEFKSKVQTASSKIGEIRAKNPKLKPETNDKLTELEKTLTGFTWTPPV